MKQEKIDFLKEYKMVCIKHKMQVLGFDDGAYISSLKDEEYELECLAFEEIHYNDNSVGMRNLRFINKNDLKNSISSIKAYTQSTNSIKEEFLESDKYIKKR